MQEHRAAVERFLGRGISSFTRVEGGWAYHTYEVDGDWIFQFPRLPGEEITLHRQISLLPELAREVSAPIPVPELVSDDPPCMGYRKIPGVPFTEAGPHGIWPERVGRFLYDLHLVPPEFVGMRSRAVDDIREERRAEVGRLSEVVLPALDTGDRSRAEAMCAEYLENDANWRFATCLTHGDLGPEHILVTQEGDLAGVIDWGDASIGDPVWDFAWLLNAAAEVGERALAAYGGAPDERFRERARFSFALMPWHEVEYGSATGQPSFVESGIAGAKARLM